MSSISGLIPTAGQEVYRLLFVYQVTHYVPKHDRISTMTPPNPNFQTAGVMIKHFFFLMVIAIKKFHYLCH